MYSVSIWGKFSFADLLPLLYKLIVCACVCLDCAVFKAGKIKIQKYYFLFYLRTAVV